MKKKLLILFTFVCMFFMVTKVYATIPEITCKQTKVNKGDQIECEISLAEAGAEVTFDDKVSLYSGAKFLNSSGTHEIVFEAIKAGKSNIKVENEASEVKTITIEIIEKTTTTKTTTTTTKAKSDNNYLSSISVNEEELSDFSKTTTKYYVEVDNDTEKISIDATAEDELASVDIDGPKSLSVGDNEYTISVTSESNTKKIYKVIVTRAEEEKSSSTDVKNIKIKGYNLNFDKNSKTFHLNIDKEDTELDITVTLKDKNADYEIEGNENLKDGSEIKIKVTAEDGTTDTYRIIIEKKETNMMPVIIGIIILLIIIIIVIVMVVINKKKKKNSSSKSTKNEVKDKDDNEKTKEMPTIDSEEEKSDDHDETYEQIPIDNDEEEKTRMLSFAEEERLEKTKVINSDLDNDIDEEFEKTMLFNTDDFDDE